MGAALKMDPTRIRVTEFWKVEGDPLARALRKRFKHNGCFPEKKFLCVYSDELLTNHPMADTIADDPSPVPIQRRPWWSAASDDTLLCDRPELAVV